MSYKFTLPGARVNAGLTQDQVAQSLQVSRATVNSWEKGKSRVNTTTLMALSQIYHVNVDDFILPERFTES